VVEYLAAAWGGKVAGLKGALELHQGAGALRLTGRDLSYQEGRQNRERTSKRS